MEIREPIWKDRSISVAKTKVGRDGCLVEILYKDKSGKAVFPFKYLFKVDENTKESISGGTPCWNKKIADLETVENV